MTEDVRLRSRAEDGPERAMAPDGQVVHRDKGIARGTLGVAAVFGSLVGGTATAGVMAGAPLWTLAVPAALAAAMGVFSIVQAVVRTAVTRDEVIVSAGIRNRRIPIASIVSLEVLAGGGLAPASVRIDYEEGGREKTFRVASRDPNGLVAAIEKVRQRGAARARVELSEDLGEAEEPASAERSRGNRTRR